MILIEPHYIVLADDFPRHLHVCASLSERAMIFELFLSSMRTESQVLGCLGVWEI